MLFTEEQAMLIWKAGQEYWKTSGDSITFEELTEKMEKKEYYTEEQLDKAIDLACEMESGYIPFKYKKYPSYNHQIKDMIKK